MSKDDLTEEDVLSAAAMVGDNEKKHKKWKAAALATWGLLVYNYYSLTAFLVAAYLWTGFEVAKNAEYGFTDYEFYLSLVFWLPMLLGGGAWRLFKEVVE